MISRLAHSAEVDMPSHLMETLNVQVAEICRTIPDKVESLMGVHDELHSSNVPYLSQKNLGSPDCVKICI